MNTKTLKEAIPLMFKAGIVPFIWGRHGIGKSQILKQVAKDLGDWYLFDCRLNTQSDVGDIIGLQDFKRDEKGKIVATTHYKPQWLKKAIDFCEANPKKGAIIFFDELNRAARYDMVGPIFQMSIDKRLHIWKFPENLHIVVASNPNTGDYNVINVDDEALLDRFGHIKFTPSKEEFFSFAKENEADDDLISFLAEQPKFIEREIEDFSINDFARPSRRTWLDQVSKLRKQNISKNTLREIMTGLVGTEIAISFMKHLESDDKPLTVEEILNEYVNRTTKSKNKSKHAIKVSKFKKSATGQRIDLFNITIENLKTYLTNREEPITEVEGKNLIDFIVDLPQDIVVSFLRSIFTFSCCRDFFSNTKYRKKELKEITIEIRNLKEEKKSQEG